MGLIRGLAGALLGRCLQAAAMALAVATICFVALHTLPGDMAVRVAVGRYGESQLSDSTLADIRHGAGLDRPVLLQYAAWVGGAAAGRLGRSLVTDRPVLQDVAPRLRVTLTVGALGAAVALVLALPAGIAAGLWRGGRIDRTVASGAALLASVPSFVLGTLLVGVFAIRLHWLPVAGNATAAALVIPSLALGIGLAPGLARVVRHGVATAVAAPYTQFARMRGVPPWRIALAVVARPALTPALAYAPVLAMQFLEGFVAIELLFNLDGLGLLLVRSLLARDIPVVMATAILIALMLSAVTAVTDLLLHLADPRPLSRTP